MSVFLSPIGNGWQFFSRGGIPLIGGKLYTYAAGTTTPLATFTDATGTVQNANPIVFLSDGRLTNEVWLTGGFSYRFDLKDALGNLIGTYDNLYGINSSPIVSVTTYGALGNGVHDDSFAFQAAHDALPSTGGTILVPNGGWWIFANAVNSSKSAVRWLGSGMGNASNIRVADTTIEHFHVTGSDTIFEDLSFTAAAQSTANYAINGSSAANGLQILNCDFDGVYSAIASTGAKTKFRAFTIRNIKPLAGVGINFNGTAEVRQVSQGILENAPGSDAFAGILILGGAGYLIEQVDAFKMGSPVAIEPTSGVVSAVTIQNCELDTSTSAAVRINPTGGAVVQRVSIGAGTWISSCQDGVHVIGVCQGINIDGCRILANTRDGVRVDSGATLDGLVVTGNMICGNTGSGVNIGANEGNFSITCNHIGSGEGFGANNIGINVAAGTSNKYVIALNNMVGNSTQISDGGSGTTKFVGKNVGVVSSNFGSSAAITAGNTSVNVAHGLWKAPALGQIMVTPVSTSLGAASSYSVTAPDATNFTINLNLNPATTVTFAWRATTED